jgi:hypothetical protein
VQEVWLPVPIEGYEHLYRVSNLGRVWSVRANRCLKDSDRADGHRQVNLCRNGKPRSFQVHRLVALAFIPNDDPAGKPLVLHGPNGVTDNSAANLSWGDHAQNNGPDKVRDGAQHGNGVRAVKGTTKAVALADELTALYQPGMHLPVQQEVARTFGVSMSTVTAAWKIMRSDGRVRRGTDGTYRTVQTRDWREFLDLTTRSSTTSTTRSSTTRSSTTST